MKWIFQVNPGRCDIWRSYFNDEPLENWDAPRQRYRDQLRPGDRAAIWICGNRGQPWRVPSRAGLACVDGELYYAGVYGFATIADDGRGRPVLWEAPIEPDSGWCEDDVGQWRWWVNFAEGSTSWLDRPVLRSVLKADPRFEDAAILRMPRWANPFPVTAEQWRAITSRVRRRAA